MSDTDNQGNQGADGAAQHPVAEPEAVRIIVTSANPGTQEVLAARDIPAPDYELMDWEIESTIDELLDSAVRLGERHSQNRIAMGRRPVPHAHRACTAYHAIECIRYLQKKIEDLQERYDNALLEQNGDDA